MIRSLFLVYGLAVMSLLSLAEYRGWSLNRISQVPERSEVGAGQSRLLSFGL